ncbi:succinyl-diaminopimelate desuccinylase [Altericroceibacterium spongiae]|uniref:Succinyl-diaminopimelate desuccinylase n=1 Tax=Altericroceibacterium spongiae TaxID=2320269 RepID=A0A420EM40_9SPHN|nr:succinyl-diaminopimelate desuccinylase [Altericroceibacterium spongiae]RKF21748.1 succinyl-diaminopimelate desuccinylase [Altericroceibacterium spongiae]
METQILSAIDIAEKLLACESVTPARGEVFDCLAALLEPLGFTCRRFVAGEAPDGPVENCFAIRKGALGTPHFAFAGHLDVVPPGEGWTSAPFLPERRGDLLYGRGAVDMKGSIASMIAAVQTIPQEAGTISFIITGDEEGPAVYGTRALIDLIRELGEEPDLCLVGEPTSVNRLGDMMKIGRRGSVNIFLEVEGVQGHVAYPHLADNPVPRLVAMLSELDRLHLDDGTDWFQPSNLEITEVEIGNPAHNVIPGRAKGRISIRFNDLHSGKALGNRVIAIADRHGGVAQPVISGEPFLTPPGSFSQMIADAVEAETGIVPEASTSGGTSDARFLKDLCPVIEFGLVNATMHKRDEAVAMEDLEVLARIYRRVTLSAFKV